MHRANVGAVSPAYYEFPDLCPLLELLEAA